MSAAQSKYTEYFMAPFTSEWGSWGLCAGVLGDLLQTGAPLKAMGGQQLPQLFTGARM